MAGLEEIMKSKMQSEINTSGRTVKHTTQEEQKNILWHSSETSFHPKNWVWVSRHLQAYCFQKLGCQHKGTFNRKQAFPCMTQLSRHTGLSRHIDHERKGCTHRKRSTVHTNISLSRKHENIIEEIMAHST